MTTTGTGVQATDIDVEAALTWSATNTLALDSYQSITVDQPPTESSEQNDSLSV